MLLVNGLIIVISENGGFDDDGNPIIVNPNVKRKRIPCNYVRSSYNGKGYYEDGKFYHGSYTILIEESSFDPCRIELQDEKGNKLGDYNVRRNGIVNLMAVGMIQLTV